jgi:hypothetical protein
MSFEDVMKKFDMSCHYVIIHRKGYEYKPQHEMWKWKVEIGFSTMRGAPSYYLFLFLEESELAYFLEKYKLNELVL